VVNTTWISVAQINCISIPNRGCAV
jgi:hypothetical protein